VVELKATNICHATIDAGMRAQVGAKPLARLGQDPKLSPACLLLVVLGVRTIVRPRVLAMTLATAIAMCGEFSWGNHHLAVNTKSESGFHVVHEWKLAMGTDARASLSRIDEQAVEKVAVASLVN